MALSSSKRPTLVDVEPGSMAKIFMCPRSYSLLEFFRCQFETHVEGPQVRIDGLRWKVLFHCFYQYLTLYSKSRSSRRRSKHAHVQGKNTPRLSCHTLCVKDDNSLE